MRFKQRHPYGRPRTRSWPHQHPMHRWPEVRQDKQRFLFLRFARGLAVFALLAAGGIALLSWLLTRIVGGSGQTTAVLWIVGLVLVLGFPLLMAGLALRAFRSFATPLADVMAAADAVAEGDLSVRVPVHGSGEFTRLAQSFNRMTEELARSDQQRRNLTADVAHELRNPLQIIQGNLEGILDGVYEPTAEHLGATLEETRLLTRLVEDLRTLSLAEAGQLPLVWEPVDVAELLADVRTSFSGQAEAAGIALQIETAEAPAAGAITGDVGRLNQVLSNLLANALRYTSAGGTITLRATARPDGGRIVIQDTGQGISAADLPYVFDRFWRGDRAVRTPGGPAAAWDWPSPGSWCTPTAAASPSPASWARGPPLRSICRPRRARTNLAAKMPAQVASTVQYPRHSKSRGAVRHDCQKQDDSGAAPHACPRGALLGGVT